MLRLLMCDLMVERMAVYLKCLFNYNDLSRKKSVARQMGFSWFKFLLDNNLTSKHKLLEYLHCQVIETLKQVTSQ